MRYGAGYCTLTSSFNTFSSLRLTSYVTLEIASFSPIPNKK